MKSIREDSSTPVQNGPEKFKIDKNLLPSKGRYYKTDLFARKLTALEVKALSKVNLNNVNVVFNDTIEKAISGIDTNQIRSGDKLWLIYYLRSITYHDFPFTVAGKCKSCGRSSIFQYKLENLDVTYAKEDLVKDLVLPNGDKVSLEFPTIEVERAIEDIKSRQQFAEQIDPDMMLVASHIRKLNDQPLALIEAYWYFTRGRGSAEDFSKLNSHLKKYTFGARPAAVFKCVCGAKMFPPVPLISKFFVPDL